MSGLSPDLRRSIGFWGGTAILVGTMIGAGIFRTPSSIAAALPNPGAAFFLWVLFGGITMCGALSLAELATLLPRTGGTYVYLHAAYGDAVAFVVGWLYMLAAVPSVMAALAVFIAEMTCGLFGIVPAAAPGIIPAIALAMIVALSFVNIAGVRPGTAIQSVLTLAKVGALVALIVGAFAFGHGDFSRLAAESARPIEPGGLLAAIQSVLYTYSGWIAISFVGGELTNPQHLMSRVILVGTGCVVALYLLANVSYYYLLPLSDLPGQVPARVAMQAIAGPAGANAMTACILASVIGALNGVIMTKARVAYALAREGLSFAFLGSAHPTRATPHRSILIQGAVAAVLVLVLHQPVYPTRLFDRLTAYFVMVEWLALLFAIGSIFVLRRKMPDAPRPYRVPGYPFVPLIFVVGTTAGLGAVLWSTCTRGDYAPLAGLLLVGAGFPAYWLWRRSNPARAGAVAAPGAASGGVGRPDEARTIRTESNL